MRRSFRHVLSFSNIGQTQIRKRFYTFIESLRATPRCVTKRRNHFLASRQGRRESSNLRRILDFIFFFQRKYDFMVSDFLILVGHRTRTSSKRWTLLLHRNGLIGRVVTTLTHTESQDRCKLCMKR